MSEIDKTLNDEELSKVTGGTIFPQKDSLPEGWSILGVNGSFHSSWHTCDNCDSHAAGTGELGMSCMYCKNCSQNAIDGVDYYLCKIGQTPYQK